ncbi:hypothetical protein GL213_00760 [Halogeometricum borinquense]|uniref:Uncharacterized protein n=1 Tax=Halogeometricum borinquense TaxID=60847 RepID=A0A6C0UEE5_9EURY|nr:hypothetical protein G3I44_04240 [Halogeometricum borinquense]QIQ75199.1 hypothetical protein GL213_00760 [Halogeometricum borinquense]
MANWFRLYTKIYTYHYAVLGIAGVVATVLFASPRTDFIHIGPLQLDVFFISLALFGALLALSVTDKYDPEDYGLDSSNSEK